LAARALLDAAAGWLRARGRDRMVGPMDFTTNDEIGVLIAGHEHAPIILCPWCGCRGRQDPRRPRGQRW
jgi:hypothetical protein